MGRAKFIFYFDNISVIMFTLYGNIQSEHNLLRNMAQVIMHDLNLGVCAAHVRQD
jgi:hypothetical protein